MARIDAKWGNFWNMGQTWYHFWQDTETSGGAVVYEVPLSDSVTVSDTSTKSVVLLKADELTANEVLANSVSLVSSDSVTVSDTEAKSLLITSADSVTVSDDKSKTLNIQSSDSVTVTDGESKELIITIADSVTVSDNQTADEYEPTIYTVDISDSVTVNDVFSYYKPVVTVSGGGGEGSYQKWREVYERQEAENKRKRILNEDDELLLMILEAIHLR